MILHTFNKPLALEKFGIFVQKNDNVVFIEDGVFCLLTSKLALNVESVFALEADVLARGLTGRLNGAVKCITYQELVEICSEASSISNWF